MNRLFCHQENVVIDKIVIRDKGQLHHALNVLRLKPKEKLVICDENANQYETEIESISAKEMVLKIKEKRIIEVTPKISLTIGCAIPKKSKMDEIIDKLTQLGAERIIPLNSERVIVKLDQDKKGRRLLRWQKIALSASKQSQRNSICVVEAVTDFQQIIKRAGEFELKLIPNLAGKRRTLKDILAQKAPKNILVLIGPEGDFSPKEVSQAISAGFIPVTFGDAVLRVETAAVYIASVLNYEFG